MDFYDCDPTEQGRRLETLARSALDRWGIDANADVSLIKHRENAVFSVSSGGARYALRVHRAGYHTDNRLRSELQWIAAINSPELRTPQVVPATDGSLFAHVSAPGVPESRQVDVLEWFDGTPIGSVEEGFADAATAIHVCTTVGRLMAASHDHASEWKPPAGFERHAWDIDGLLGSEPFWGRYLDNERLSDDQRLLLLQATEKARAELTEYGTSPDRYGLIHADFAPENLLQHGEDVCLIDFDDAGWGWHVFDLVTPLFFLQDEPDYELWFNALVNGYRSRRALDDTHLDHLPVFMLARGFTYLGWMHTRSETETAQELGAAVVDMVCGLARGYLDAQP